MVFALAGDSTMTRRLFTYVEKSISDAAGGASLTFFELRALGARRSALALAAGFFATAFDLGTEAGFALAVASAKRLASSAFFAGALLFFAAAFVAGAFFLVATLMHRHVVAAEAVVDVADALHERAEIIERDATPDELLHEIVTLAVRRGSPDNATGVLIFVDAVT